MRTELMEVDKDKKQNKVRQRHPIADRQVKMIEKMTKNVELLYRKSVKLAGMYEKTDADNNSKLAVINMAAALLKFKKDVTK